MSCRVRETNTAPIPRDDLATPARAGSAAANCSPLRYGCKWLSDGRSIGRSAPATDYRPCLFRRVGADQAQRSTNLGREHAALYPFAGFRADGERTSSVLDEVGSVFSRDFKSLNARQSNRTWLVSLTCGGRKIGLVEEPSWGKPSRKVSGRRPESYPYLVGCLRHSLA